MTSPTHPDLETLERFVLGRLDRRAMARVEAHLGGCSSCGRAAMNVPDDRLVALLRTQSAGPAAGRFHERGNEVPVTPKRGATPMSSPDRSPRKLGKLAVLACAAAILGSSLTGCSRGAGAGAFSPEDQAKMKASFQNKFQGHGETNAKAGKKSR